MTERKRATLAGEVYYFIPADKSECPTVDLDTSKLDGPREPTDAELKAIEVEQD